VKIINKKHKLKINETEITECLSKLNIQIDTFTYCDRIYEKLIDLKWSGNRE